MYLLDQVFVELDNCSCYPPTPPACESSKQHTQHPTLYITRIRSRGEFEGGDPYGRLTPTHRPAKAGEGRRGGPKAADRVGALVLFLEEAPRETAVFRHEYPPPRGRRLSNTGTIFFEKPLKINEHH